MFQTFLAKLIRLSEVHRSRRQLARLTDDHLRDIGVSRFAAELEAERPPWDGARFHKTGCVRRDKPEIYPCRNEFSTFPPREIKSL